MAKNATIHKIDLSVTDMDRHYYENHRLTIAQHPSETDERMMVRLLAFALHADEYLEMTRGLSTEDEPDIWQKSLSGELELWITLGQPSEKIIRQSCSKSDQVVIYSYGGRPTEAWWDKMRGTVSRFHNLRIISLPEVATKALARHKERSLALQVTVQDGEIMIHVGDEMIEIRPEIWKDARKS